MDKVVARVLLLLSTISVTTIHTQAADQADTQEKSFDYIPKVHGTVRGTRYRNGCTEDVVSRFQVTARIAKSGQSQPRLSITSCRPTSNDPVHIHIPLTHGDEWPLPMTSGYQWDKCVYHSKCRRKPFPSSVLFRQPLDSGQTKWASSAA